MKIRAGFVSNSSTTSFVIYGIWIHGDDLINKLKENGLVPEGKEPDPYDILGEEGITCEFTPSEEYCVGFNFDEIPDDVVVGEWKKEKTEILKKIFGEETKCSLNVEGFNDNF